jgi:hypothetical protein
MAREYIEVAGKRHHMGGVVVIIDKTSPLIGGPQSAVDAEDFVTRITGRAPYVYMDGDGLILIGSSAQEAEGEGSPAP